MEIMEISKHILSDSDSLYTISHNSKVKVLDLMRVNYSNIYEAKLGDIIDIPIMHDLKTASVEELINENDDAIIGEDEGVEERYYYTKSGDTLEKVLDLSGIGIEELMLLNNENGIILKENESIIIA